MPGTATLSAPSQSEAPAPADAVDDFDDPQRIESIAEELRVKYRGVEVTVTGISSRRVVSDSQRGQTAELFNAAATSVSVSSNLWDRKSPPIKEFRKLIAAIQDLYTHRDYTLPTVRVGLRLVKKDKLREFNEKMKICEENLIRGAEVLESQWPGLVAHERSRRGKLFKDEDYAFRPTQQCKVVWRFPTIEVDPALAEVDSSIFQQELVNMRAQMEDIVRKCEGEMAKKLLEALSDISERLENDEGGTPKKFKDSTITKLFEELDYIQTQLKDNQLGGSAVQEATVQIRNLVQGHGPTTLPAALRENEDYRESIRQQVEAIGQTLVDSAVVRPRRMVMLGNQPRTPQE